MAEPEKEMWSERDNGANNAARVVVTGLGVLAPNGNSVSEFWSALLNGKSGLDRIRSFDASPLDVNVGGELKNFEPERLLPRDLARRVDRFSQLGLCAANAAVADADLSMEGDSHPHAAVVIGTGLGGIIFQEAQIRNVLEHLSRRSVQPSTVPRVSANSVSSQVVDA